jgi:hypothetical protein
MRAQERVYRALLLAYPKNHRDEYGMPMTQLMRDRLRDEGGGWRTGLVWMHLLGDVMKNALNERMETAMDTIKTGWWRILAALIAVVIAGAGIRALFEGSTGPWYKHVFGTAALLAGPLATLVGLVMWTRHRRNASILIGVGVLPGCAAIVLFWHPLFLAFGVLSMAVLVSAIDDVDRIHRGSKVSPTASTGI